MSRAAPCGGCLAGRHELHERDWNIHPGVIGGEYCDCQGTCAEEFEARAAALLEVFFTALAHPSTDPDG